MGSALAIAETAPGAAVAAPQAVRRRRWLALRLRTMMLLVLLAALLFWSRGQARQHAAVDALERLLPNGVTLVSSRGIVARNARTSALQSAVRSVQAEHAQWLAVGRLTRSIANARTPRGPGVTLDQKVTEAAMTAVVLLGPEAKAAVPELIGTLEHDQSTPIRGLAVRALVNVGASHPETIPALVRALKARPRDAFIKEPGAIAAFAAEALWHVDPADQRAVDGLAEALGDREIAVRVAAARALTHMDARRPRSATALITALNDPAHQVREAAVCALHATAIDDTKQISLAVPLLDDPSPDVRRAAGTILRSLGRHVERTERNRKERAWLAEDRARDLIDQEYRRRHR